MDFGLAKSFNYVNLTRNTVNSSMPQQHQIFNQQQMPDQHKFQHFDSVNKDDERIKEIKKGTTTLGFKFQGGVIVACDSRASEGSLHSTKNIRKIIEVNPELLATIAGGAGDCIYWEDYLGMQARLYELRNGEKVSVAAASRMLINIIYNKKGSNFSMGCMFGGVDKTGQHLYYLDDDGTRIKGDVFSLGSGSTYCLGAFDNKYNFNMTVDQAIALAHEAIAYACHRDAGSAGFVRVYYIDDKGWKNVSYNNDAILANDLMYKYYNEKGMNGIGEDADKTIL